MTPVIGFAPDADQTTPGLFSDCTNMIPALIGMQGAPSAITTMDVPVLPDVCKGAGVIYKLDYTRRTFAATVDAIYEYDSGAWIDQSDVGGYVGGSDTRWSITQFGDATIMSNRADTIQRSLNGAFSAIAGAPKAEVVFSVGAFVMALNVADGTDKPDGWHCSAAYDDTDWVQSITTQAASGRLVATPGRLTAGARLGDYAVAYKDKSIYIGQYVGAPVIWDWQHISGGDAGCVGKNAICDIGGAHFFVGADNFWIFDGVRPAPLGDGTLRKWFIDNSNPAFLYKTICTFDRDRNLVWVFYPSKSSLECDSAVVYHVQSKQWGRADREIQAVMTFVEQGLTMDTLDTVAATFDTLPDISFDSPFWSSASRSLSIFNTDNRLQKLVGVSTASDFTTGEVGDDDALSMLQQIRLRYAVKPTAATAQTFHAMNSGETYIAGATGSMNDGKFDCLKTSRWHKAKVSFTGDVRVTHQNAKFKPAGMR